MAVAPLWVLTYGTCVEEARLRGLVPGRVLQPPRSWPLPGAVPIHPRPTTLCVPWLGTPLSVRHHESW